MQKPINMISSNKSDGYAIVGVLVLMVIGTGIVLMANKDSAFFTKIAGFFNRSKAAQSLAVSGLQLAELDLKVLTQNVRANKLDTRDTFTHLIDQDLKQAFNQGLHLFNVDTSDRVITPRFSQTQGNLTLNVTYFPEDPCMNAICSDTETYNKQFPKLFTILSQSQDANTGQTYTVESRILIRLESFSEISYGITGVGDYPKNNDYSFMPSVYGRTHINIPKNNFSFNGKIGELFINDGAMPEFQLLNSNTFLGTLTLEHPEDHYRDPQLDINLPFLRGYQSDYGNVTDSNGVKFNVVSEAAMPIELRKGIDYPVDIVSEPGDTDYSSENDPADQSFFNTLKSNISATSGQDLSNFSACNYNPVTNTTEANVCLKMDGEKVLHYSCANALNPITRPGEFFMQPTVDRIVWASDPANLDPSFDIVEKINAFPDRYIGERNDVKNGTSTIAASYPLDGVFFCQNTDCDCNIHIKGIYKGSIHVAADNIVIEGDIVNADQNDIANSTYVFGATAKNNIVIPEGIPQAANTAPSDSWFDQYKRVDLAMSDHPFENCSDPNATCTPKTLSESYLNITNFIADDGLEYIDREITSENSKYLQASAWIDPEDENHQKTYFNSPMALDLDGHFFAGQHMVVNGIFNPELTNSDNDRGAVVLTCENPPTCDEFKYREPSADKIPLVPDLGMQYGHIEVENPLYIYNETSQDWSHVKNAAGDLVQPVIYKDGAIPNRTYIPDPQDGWVTVNHQYDMYEAVPRMRNELLFVQGSINSKYFLTHTAETTTGFRNKIILDDPRAGSIDPPGFPKTNYVVYNELYRKSYLGTSSLLSQSAPTDSGGGPQPTNPDK